VTTSLGICRLYICVVFSKSAIRGHTEGWPRPYFSLFTYFISGLFELLHLGSKITLLGWTYLCFVSVYINNYFTESVIKLLSNFTKTIHHTKHWCILCNADDSMVCYIHLKLISIRSIFNEIYIFQLSRWLFYQIFTSYFHFKCSAKICFSDKQKNVSQQQDPNSIIFVSLNAVSVLK
jgi:hypothetical protein